MFKFFEAWQDGRDTKGGSSVSSSDSKPSVARFFNIQWLACCRKIVYRLLLTFSTVNVRRNEKLYLSSHYLLCGHSLEWLTMPSRNILGGMLGWPRVNDIGCRSVWWEFFLQIQFVGHGLSGLAWAVMRFLLCHGCFDAPNSYHGPFFSTWVCV